MKISHCTLSTRRNAITPARTGVTTQLAAIVATSHQWTASKPIATTAKPMMAPTIECVVDTGQPNLEATVSQIAAARRADSMPMTSRFGSCSRASASMMPLRIVEVTSPPARNAPRNSNTPAIRMATPTVMAPEPTDVPIEFRNVVRADRPSHVQTGTDRRD